MSTSGIMQTSAKRPVTFDGPDLELQIPSQEQETCGVNIRGVPKAVWRRARQNALLSNLPFKEFVIKLLEQSQPFLSIAKAQTLPDPSVDS